MQKGIKYFIWLVFIISYPAWCLISDEILNGKNTNYNSTGMIIYGHYNSDLNIHPNIIKIYGYQESSELTISYETSDMLFALIPREYGCTASLSEDVATNQILRMNVYLNNRNFLHNKKDADISATEKVIDDQATQNDETNKKIASLLKPFNDYLTVQNLAEYFNKEKTSQISKSLAGSHGLFMPKNINMLNKFNGSGRTLSSAVSVIDDLLLTAKDFNIPNQNCISKNQFTELQLLILTAIKQAKTVIFIPEYMARKDTGDIRLPIALINKVSLDKNTGQITVNLLFCQKAINDFAGFYDFINARNYLLKGDMLAEQWEFIDYTLELAGSDDSHLQYKFISAQIEPNSCINHQTNNQHHAITGDSQQIGNEEFLLDECRQPTETELNRINASRKNNLLVSNQNFLNSLISTYDYNNNFINTKLYELITNTGLDNKIKQEEIIKDILKYNNDNIDDPCEHYQRKCIVQFDCSCNNFWNCHRCHNKNLKQTDCKSNKIKTCDIKKIKCLICNYQQDFNAETSHSCSRCQTKFADYYCGKCKHFTGTEDSPYHCEKCGICRKNGDKNFHCDTCSKCHVNLRGDYTCREESAHR